MQQPIRKSVGRPLTPQKRLAHLEDMIAFLKNTRPMPWSRPREIIIR